jgi:hypothetical protein
MTRRDTRASVGTAGSVSGTESGGGGAGVGAGDGVRSSSEAVAITQSAPAPAPRAAAWLPELSAPLFPGRCPRRCAGAGFCEAGDRLIRDVFTAGAIVRDYVVHREDVDRAPCTSAAPTASCACAAGEPRRVHQAGQHVGQLEYLLPPEYVRTLKVPDTRGAHGQL